MRRIIRLFCLLAALALLPAALRLGRLLPPGTRTYVEKKYSGWNGVLRAWVCEDLPCSGVTGWLNARASAFERAHEGVYLEFETVSADTILFMRRSGVRLPDLILFPPGLLSVPEGLLPIDAETGSALREGLSACGSYQGILYALPVARGGYCWVYNRTLTDGLPDDWFQTEQMIGLPTDEPRCNYSAALICLMSAVPEGTDAADGDAAPESDIDLGLPAAARAAVDVGGLAALTASEDAYSHFVSGELAVLAATQQELVRLERLSDAGRAPDWAAEVTGEIAFADQLLMLGLVAREGADAAERAALCHNFLTELLSEDSQKELRRANLLPVTGVTAYSDFSVLATFEAQINCRSSLAPACFSEYWNRDFAGIVRDFISRKIDRGEALARVRRFAGNSIN